MGERGTNLSCKRHTHLTLRTSKQGRDKYVYLRMKNCAVLLAAEARQLC